ncbi:MAG: GTP pyrophosphokinase family protein [Ruminococcaceae bacterium]|nr:GTP pyrophosphokinase family protein [Oscillospiraceae bacterium]
MERNLNFEEKRIREFFGPEFIRRSQNFVQKFHKLMAYYRCAMMEIETKFNVLNEEFSLRYDRNPINGMKTRLKSMESIRAKLEKKGLPLSVDSVEKNLCDVAGVRVVCSFPEDVYMLADALLSQDDITLVTKKDYIQNPKSNGYRSLHLIVTVPIFLAKEKKVMKVEIQLRTIAMDFWASLEHQLRYKKDFDFSESMIQELKTCADLSAELDVRMDRIRASVQPEDEKASGDT